MPTFHHVHGSSLPVLLLSRPTSRSGSRSPVPPSSKKKGTVRSVTEVADSRHDGFGVGPGIKGWTVTRALLRLGGPWTPLGFPSCTRGALRTVSSRVSRSISRTVCGLLMHRHRSPLCPARFTNRYGKLTPGDDRREGQSRLVRVGDRRDA